LRIRQGLESDHEASVNFFSQNTPETLAQLDDNQLLRIWQGLEGRNQDSLNQLNTQRDEARDNYFENKPNGIAQEQMEQNINGLYVPMINQIIEYSQRAVTELRLPPEEVYNQRFDRQHFNEVRGTMYAEGAAEGLFPGVPDGAARNIGSFLDANDATSMAQVNSAARDGAEAEYNRLNPNN
jgi:hypothetical protein